MSANYAGTLRGSDRPAVKLRKASSLPNSALSGQRAVYVGGGRGQGETVTIHAVTETRATFDGDVIRRATVARETGDTFEARVTDLRIPVEEGSA